VNKAIFGLYKCAIRNAPEDIENVKKNPLQEKSINSSRFEADTSSSVTLLCIMNSRVALLENADADFEAQQHTISGALQRCW
jgi:hypothetical protein